MMTQPRQVTRNAANQKKCLCMKCPSYTLTCKMLNMPGNMLAMMQGIDKVKRLEGLFCAFSKSKCITREKGCVCMTCALFKEYHLDKAYYCLGGKAVKV